MKGEGSGNENASKNGKSVGEEVNREGGVIREGGVKNSSTNVKKTSDQLPKGWSGCKEWKMTMLERIASLVPLKTLAWVLKR